MPDKEIELPDWQLDTVEYTLPATELTEDRAEPPAQLPVAGSTKYDPVVSLPRSTFDCVDLDRLRDHPAVDALVRAQLDDGMSFRLLRFPFSVRPAKGAKVEELRFTVQLDDVDGVGAPRVHSIFPVRLTVDEERKTEVTLEPALKLGSVLDVRGGRIGRSVSVHQPRSTTVGFWSEHGADWLMRAPDKDPVGIEGTSEFLVIVRWTTEARLRVTLSFAAMVATPFLRWGTRRFERAYPPLALAGCPSVV
jgi:hypothetical protein